MSRVTQEHIAQAGVVGAGGAGFPTHVKLAAKADTVLINAAECEPLLHKDKEVLRACADGVLEGLAIAIELVGARQGVIGVKGKYHDVIESLRPKLAPNVGIVPLRDAYPAGDEFMLVYDCLGRVVPPGGIPLAVGAVVMNVETALNVSAADRRPVTEKFLTVAGAVTHPVTLRVPVGVTLAQCVAAAGGATVPDANYIVGGVMMGWLEDNQQALVDKTTGGIIVLGADQVVVRRRRQDWRQIARIGRSACDQCTYCTALCPRWLLGHPIEPHRAMRSLGFNLVGEANAVGTSFCCECNLCSLYSCPEDLDPKNVCTFGKPVARQAGLAWQGDPASVAPHPLGSARRVPMRRLMTRLGLNGFANVGPLADREFHPRRVVLPLKQHAGAAAVPRVAAGTRVTPGQVIAAPAPGALGATLHASIGGVVREVGEAIVIEA